MLVRQKTLAKYIKYVSELAQRLKPDARDNCHTLLTFVNDFDCFVFDAYVQQSIDEGSLYPVTAEMQAKQMVASVLSDLSEFQTNMAELENISEPVRSYIHKHKDAILCSVLAPASSNRTSTGSATNAELDRRKWLMFKILFGALTIKGTKTMNSRSTMISLYLILMLFICTMIGYVVFLGWTQKPTVNIELNVGEIIAGILAGSGALLAGGAYALKTLTGNGDPADDNHDQ